MQIPQRGNALRWQPGQRGHVESYFLKLNEPRQRFALWLKFTVYAPLVGPALGEVWAVWFDLDDPARNRAWKSSLPLADCQLPQPAADCDPELRFGACTFGGGSSHGQLRQGEEEIRWRLRWSDGAPPLWHLQPRWLYSARWPKSKICAPYPSSLFGGEIELNGRSYQLRAARGTQGHNWGREHAHAYAWAHCNAFDRHEEDTWFEGFSSRLKLGPLTSPWLSVGHLCLDGRRFAFNRLRRLSRGRVDVGLQHWRFRLENDEYALEGVFAAPVHDFICLHYRNPDDALAYCLNSKLANAELTLLDRHNRMLARLTSRRNAALEVLSRDPQHGVVFGA